MFKKIFPFVVIFIVVIVLYYPVLFTYFSHDDFFHFKVSLTDGSLESFTKLFGFYPFEIRKIAFYRPIFRELLYNGFYFLFGLNQIPFRILQFAIHFINIYLVFNLIQQIYKNKVISFFSAFFFGICATNVSSFYYLAGGIQAQGATMFILLTLIFFINYLNTKNSIYKIFSFLTFLFGLASHEQASLIPILLTGIILIKFNFRDALKKMVNIWPYFLIVTIYVFLNIKIIGYSSTETQYKMVFNPKTTANTLMWYTNWALGAPEMLIDFVKPGFKLNPSLMHYWGNYFRIIFPTLIISVLITSFNFLNLFVNFKKIFEDKRFWFFLLWFPIGILPVLFLPQHKSTHYLYPSLPAFWAVMGVISYNSFQSIKKHHPHIAWPLFLVLFISLLTLSVTSAVLGRTNYWAATRGKLAEKIIKNVKSKYPTLPKGSGIYFTNDPTYPYVAEDWKGSSRQASFALNGEDGLQLVYKDQALRVFYEDTGGVPKDFPKDSIKPIVAIY